MRVFSCACSENGDLWVTTDQGRALVRKGVSRTTPMGSGWIGVEQPRENIGLKEISIGMKSVWVIDHDGMVFYRAGITEKAPQGNKWVDLSSVVTTVYRITNISVSSNNQVKTRIKNLFEIMIS